jgi:rhodanese-related sulfurtransferase
MYRTLRIVIALAVCITVISSINPSHGQSDKSKGGVAFISAEELKARVAGNEPLVIIDVRSSNAFANSDQKIKGAIHVKLRRLEQRLSFAPLKDMPRDRPVITYCSCPADEASITAARVMLENGFRNVRALRGGWQEWLKVNGQTEKKARL